MPRVLRALWSRLRSTYWFVPTAIIAGLVAFSYVTADLDHSLPHKAILALSWVYTTGPEGARAVLEVVSQSMITVAGVVFSITTVALTMVSSQFGTRVLRTYIHDIGNQIVLGMFLGTFLYALLVLRRVGGTPAFVPSLSVAVAILLSMACVALLTYFIHHALMLIQGESIVAALAEDLRRATRTVFPERLGHGDEGIEDPLPVAEPDGNPAFLTGQHTGFVETIDNDAILNLAVEHDVVIRLDLRPGNFCQYEGILAEVWPASRLDGVLASKLEKCFRLGAHRTYEQDIEFAFQQLVVVSVRSLSPAINAQATAMDAMDRLGSALVEFGERRIPSAYRYDGQQRLRLIALPWEPGDLAESLFVPLREASRSMCNISAHLLRVIARALPRVRNLRLRKTLIEQAALVRREALDAAHSSDDRAIIEKAFRPVLPFLPSMAA